MSGVAEVVREFLDRLERGEGSVEDRTLADRLSWWASGWKARGAGAPVGIKLPENGVVAFEQTISEAQRNLAAAVARIGVPEGLALATLVGQPSAYRARLDEEAATAGAAPDESAPGKKRDRPFGRGLKSKLFSHFMVDEPPAEVVATVDAPAKWSKPGAVSVPDLEFAEMLRRDYAGEWVEVRTGELTWSQRHWLAQKVTGSGAAYRPGGSFEARLVEPEGRLFVRAVKEATDSSVPVEPAPAVAPGAEVVGDPEPVRLSGVVVDESRGSQNRPLTGGDRRRAHSSASSKAVAVIDPPAPAANDRPRPRPGETWPEWTEFAGAIRSYDGAWVEIEVSDRNSAGRNNLATAIRGQYTVFRPAGSFEATIQGGRLYARWRKGSKRG